MLVTPCTLIDAAAVPHARGVRYWSLGDFRAWAERAVGVLRAVRPLYPGRPDLAWRGDVIGRQRAVGVDLAGLLDTLERARVASLPTR